MGVFVVLCRIYHLCSALVQLFNYIRIDIQPRKSGFKRNLSWIIIIIHTTLPFYFHTQNRWELPKTKEFRFNCELVFFSWIFGDFWKKIRDFLRKLNLRWRGKRANLKKTDRNVGVTKPKYSFHRDRRASIASQPIAITQRPVKIGPIVQSESAIMTRGQQCEGAVEWNSLHNNHLGESLCNAPQRTPRWTKIKES